MTRREIWTELQKLPLDERLAIIDALLQQLRVAMASLEQPPKQVTAKQMATAAALLRRDYETNPELTAFTVLDSEDFLA